MAYHRARQPCPYRFRPPHIDLAMCSILAILDAHEDPDTLRARALRLSRLQRHRGPDWSGLYCGPRAILAHERLAIVDVLHGAQPLRTTDGALALAVNGEIYNHRALRAGLKRAIRLSDGLGLRGHPRALPRERARLPQRPRRHVRLRALRRGAGPHHHRPRSHRHHPALHRTRRRRAPPRGVRDEGARAGVQDDRGVPARPCARHRGRAMCRSATTRPRGATTPPCRAGRPTRSSCARRWRRR